MQALPHPDWLYDHLRVAGEPAEVAGFRAAAAGAGVIPWAHDLGPAAEDWFYRLAVPPVPQRRSLSLEGCRILAGQPRHLDPTLVWLGFWSADWTRWLTIQQLRACWPALRLEIRPLYDDS